MVAYNFQPRFADLIRSGSKVSTIRPQGKRRHAVAGDQVQLFTGMRTPNCVRLLDAPCLGSWPIEICEAGFILDGEIHHRSAECDELARIEGFDGFGNLQAWFDRRYGLPTRNMTQIRWGFGNAILAPIEAVDSDLVA